MLAILVTLPKEPILGLEPTCCNSESEFFENFFSLVVVVVVVVVLGSGVCLLCHPKVHTWQRFWRSFYSKLCNKRTRREVYVQLCVPKIKITSVLEVMFYEPLHSARELELCSTNKQDNPRELKVIIWKIKCADCWLLSQTTSLCIGMGEKTKQGLWSIIGQWGITPNWPSTIKVQLLCYYIGLYNNRMVLLITTFGQFPECYILCLRVPDKEFGTPWSCFPNNVSYINNRAVSSQPSLSTLSNNVNKPLSINCDRNMGPSRVYLGRFRLNYEPCHTRYSILVQCGCTAHTAHSYNYGAPCVPVLSVIE